MRQHQLIAAGELRLKQNSPILRARKRTGTPRRKNPTARHRRQISRPHPPRNHERAQTVKGIAHKHDKTSQKEEALAGPAKKRGNE